MKHAARAAGVGMSCVYEHRKKDSDFACKWDAALGVKSEMVPQIINPGGHGARTFMVKQCHNAFSGAQKEKFLRKLAETCNITQSAEYAGTTRKTVLCHRQKDPVFQAAYRQVIDNAHAELSMDLLARARFGTPKPVMSGGVQTATVKVHNDSFALRVLERLDRMSENRVAAAQAKAQAENGPDSIRARLDRRLADMRARLLETRPELVQGAGSNDGDTVE
ncbi:hypothetical protein [Sphingorhabdus sp. Alg239-R122]|uniref:hypothetical protein n=1 Tax=Sphingorhabdus sp. Alg239-R122 TaxID=2305989 RepID=UPI0013DBE7F7|nr:hypothetical protein [Sphingorhabdus sp. Alg239-R122]